MERLFLLSKNKMKIKKAAALRRFKVSGNASVAGSEKTEREIQ